VSGHALTRCRLNRTAKALREWMRDVSTVFRDMAIKNDISWTWGHWSNDDQVTWRGLRL
jgi:hypothetical protein